MIESELVRLGKLVEIAEEMTGAFWLNPPTNAGARRSYEKRHTVDWIEWEEGGNEYRARYTVNCSCSNVYAKGDYFKNGHKTTLTAIRNSYIRMAYERGLLK